MVTFFIGPTGGGKTQKIRESILRDLQNGYHVILLCPEQSAFQTEWELTLSAQSKGISQTDLEVLNFKRLANRVFRTYGGISYRSITRQGKIILLWKALLETAPALTEYQRQALSSVPFTIALLPLIGELTTYGVTPGRLNEVSQSLARENDRLSNKLGDLSLIYGCYQQELKEGYTDPSEEPWLLANLLKDNPFFKGTKVYLDGFVGFTPAEYVIIEHIIRQAEHVGIAVTIGTDDTQPVFSGVREMLNRLIAIASRFSEFQIDREKTPHRFCDPSLVFLEANLFSVKECAPYAEKTDAIRLVSAHGCYDEVEYILADIAEKVRAGFTYRDFAIIASDLSPYEGAMEALASRYHIPLHFSRKTALTEKPLLKLILTTLRIGQGGFKTEDVIALLKTGLTLLPLADCDELENYAILWQISGKGWYDEHPWQMNPSGFSTVKDEDAETLLDRLNAARELLIRPITAFLESIDGNHTIETAARALIQYLNDIGVADRMTNGAVPEDILLWNTLQDALDVLVDLLGGIFCDTALFSDLLRLVFSVSSTGSLPSSVDTVSVGTADLFRGDKIKHTYLLGVNEGVFPVGTRTNGILNDIERQLLDDEGLTLSPIPDVEENDARFRFYLAALTPSLSLTMVRSAISTKDGPTTPSEPYSRTAALFRQIEIIDTANLPDHSVQNAETAIDAYGLQKDTRIGKALYLALLSEGFNLHEDAHTKEPLVTGDIYLSKQVSELLYAGDSMTISPSRLSAFVKCPFGYHCDYSLGLRKVPSGDISYAERGTLNHYLLERFLSDCRDEDGHFSLPVRGEIPGIADALIESYLRECLGESFIRDARRTALLRRMKESILPVLEKLTDELRECRFTPLYFEKPINNSGAENAVAPLRVKTKDGVNVSLNGIIDRVDAYVKDDTAYLRVIDYKSGYKTYSIGDTEKGKNLQMPLYLFSLCNDENGTVRRDLRVNGPLVPAAMLYHRVGNTQAEEYEGNDAVDIQSKIRKTISYSGLILNDMDIVTEMDHTNPFSYIPGKIKQDGTLSGNHFITADDFRLLKDQVTAKLAEVTTAIRRGDCSANPDDDSSNNPCDTCAYRAICRRFTEDCSVTID